jgi:Protein of unknown function (DUF2874).
MKTKTLAPVILTLVMACATSSFAGEATEIKWSQVPAAAQKTISKNMGEGKIEEIKKKTRTISGKSVTIYEVQARKPDPGGKKFEIEVDEDGKLIELEDD